MKRVTVKDIAAELNISLGTVSKALTGKHGISDDTRKEVRETAKRMGYKVNRLAQGLARNPITIGIIYPKVWPEFYGGFIKGIKYVIDRLGDYNVTAKFVSISSLFSKDEIANAITQLVKMEVTGIILAPGSVTNCGDCLDDLCKKNIPVLLLGTDLTVGKRFTCVRVDAGLAGRIAGEFMGNIVHEKKAIAALIGDKDMKDHNEKLEGFEQEISHAGLSLTGAYETHDEPEVAYHLTKKLIRDIPDLGGIYVATGNSIAVCKCIVEHGLHSKVKIIATDVFQDIIQYVDDGVIQGVIFQNTVEQGRVAMEMLYQHLVERKPCEHEVLIRPNVIMRSDISRYHETFL